LTLRNAWRALCITLLFALLAHGQAVCGDCHAAIAQSYRAPREGGAGELKTILAKDPSHAWARDLLNQLP